ncbi:hypothetical protein DERP_011906 [Dermatophagoides pteronyssinus]|uniref:Uncharacterized protein n=1 Tax=Dermatophagoides pteronyssinus TaxID=6956 RepID=A0ABQ8J2N7_DERPT|nr:hypothetical protein DERP_011906 [Dermatophagoides pteronyssinus]
MFAIFDMQQMIDFQQYMLFVDFLFSFQIFVILFQFGHYPYKYLPIVFLISRISFSNALILISATFSPIISPVIIIGKLFKSDIELSNE